MAIKYLVFPGEIRSANDGDIHYITGVALIGLYGVNPQECIIRVNNPSYVDETLIPLVPRYDGKYRNEDGTPNLEKEHR